MQKLSLDALAREHVHQAGQSSAGRSAHTVFGRHEHIMRQTMVALTAGTTLAEHENPGEATVFVMSGRVRLEAGADSWEGRHGDLIIVPAGPAQPARPRGRRDLAQRRQTRARHSLRLSANARVARPDSPPGDPRVVTESGIYGQALRERMAAEPDADVLVHPECGCTTSALYLVSAGVVPAERVQVLSTGGMIAAARRTRSTKVLVATETGMLHQLRRANPTIDFAPVNERASCSFMKMITPEKLLCALREGVHEVTVPRIDRRPCPVDGRADDCHRHPWRRRVTDALIDSIFWSQKVRRPRCWPNRARRHHDESPPPNERSSR
jgi:quercetin dioxygenase-like cupin family protein